MNSSPNCRSAICVWQYFPPTQLPRASAQANLDVESHSSRVDKNNSMYLCGQGAKSPKKWPPRTVWTFLKSVLLPLKKRFVCFWLLMEEPKKCLLVRKKI